MKLFQKIPMNTRLKKLIFFITCAILTAPCVSHATINTPTNFLSLNTGLVGWWTLDGDSINWSTGQVNDLSGSGDTGQINNLPTSTSPVVGKIGQALSFNGVNSYVQSASVISSPSAFTEIGWFKRMGDSGGINSSALQRIVGGVNGGNDNQATVTKDGTKTFSQVYVSVGGYVGAPQMTITTPNNWHQVGTIWNGSYIYSVLDGVISAGTSASGTLESGSGGIVIGEYNSNTYIANGYIDDVRIYNRALSAGEVSQLYNLGK